MRIYETDGSCRNSVGDNSFGWWLSGISIDENLEDRPEFDLKTQSNNGKNGNEGTQGNGIKIYQSIVPEYPGIVEIESFALYETKYKLVEDNEKAERFKNIDSVVPSKEKLSELITPTTHETEILLSVVHFAKYENLKRVGLSKGAYKTYTYFYCLKLVLNFSRIQNKLYNHY